jgi:tripartite-type tricarboxylate transporter receptor subunit TctC
MRSVRSWDGCKHAAADVYCCATPGLSKESKVRLTILRLPVFVVGCALMLGAITGGAQAQDWPQRPVRIVVPFAAGGNIDVLGRLVAQRFSEAMGRQFIVENRVGGNGILAAEAVARSPADGYTLLWASTSVIAIFPALTKVSYDPEKDFAPVSALGTNPHVLIVNPNVPAKTVAEFIAHVKAQPNKIAYAGGGGPGSASNLVMSLFLKLSNLEMQNVSYRGTAPALTDLIAGHIPAMFIPISEAQSHAREGTIRMLAVSSKTRARQAPEVPTLDESGLPGFHAVSWTGLMAPAGTPKEIIDRMASEFAAAVKDPKFIAALDQAGVDPLGDGPEKFAAMIASEMALWGEAVRVSGVKLQ